MVCSHDETRISANLEPTVHVAYQSQTHAKGAYLKKEEIVEECEVPERDLVCLVFQVFRELQATLLN